jgi:hypothetical protein
MSNSSLREVGMNNIYVVKSGVLVDFVGWEWMTIKAFTNRDKAEAWIESYIKQDKSFNEDRDALEIDEVTLYE